MNTRTVKPMGFVELSQREVEFVSGGCGDGTDNPPELYTPEPGGIFFTNGTIVNGSDLSDGEKNGLTTNGYFYSTGTAPEITGGGLPEPATGCNAPPPDPDA